MEQVSVGGSLCLLRNPISKFWRGDPLTILQELWDREEEGDVQTTYQYVFDLREKLEETCMLARERLGKAKEHYKYYYDRIASEKKVLKSL